MTKLAIPSLKRFNAGVPRFNDRRPSGRRGKFFGSDDATAERAANDGARRVVVAENLLEL